MEVPDSINPNVSPLPMEGVESTGEVSPTTGTSATGESGVSSIGKSKTVVVPFVPDMEFPMLPFPTQDGMAIGSLNDQIVQLLQKGGMESVSEQDATSMLEEILHFQSMQADLGSKILDKWIENLKEIDEEIKRVITSFHFQQIQEQKDPAFRDQQEQQKMSIDSVFTHTNRILEQVHNQPDIAPTIGVTLGAVALIAAPVGSQALSSGAVGAVAHIGDVTMQQAAVQMAQMVPGNMAGELGLIGALMLVPLFGQITWDGAVNGAGKPGALDLQAQAEELARQVIQLGTKEGMLGNYLPALIETLPAAMVEKQPLNREQLMAMVRLILATVSLGFILAAERGGKKVPLDVLASILKGELPIPDNDPLLKSLLTMIRTQMALLPKAHLVKVIEGILAYLENSPDMKKFFKPSEVLRDAIRNMQAFRYQSLGDYEG